MSIKLPDINADYLQFRNIEIVRGDTFGLQVRLLVNGVPATITAETKVTFEISGRETTPVYQRVYTIDNTEQDIDGYINISMAPSETATLRKSDNYTYELEWLLNIDTIYTVLNGNIKVIDDKIRHG